jgi:hypothetical protein
VERNSLNTCMRTSWAGVQGPPMGTSDCAGTLTRERLRTSALNSSKGLPERTYTNVLWLFMHDGAQRASTSICCTNSSATGLSRYLRVDLLVTRVDGVASPAEAVVSLFERPCDYLLWSDYSAGDSLLSDSGFSLIKSNSTKPTTISGTR